MRQIYRTVLLLILHGATVALPSGLGWFLYAAESDVPGDADVVSDAQGASPWVGPYRTPRAELGGEGFPV